MSVPASTDDDLFDPAFLDRLRALVLRLRKRRLLKKKGLQSTPATGFTREFKDFRHYTPHDDYRAIDWRMYARLERLFIRLYEEVQEFHVHVLLDTSESMQSPHPEKRRTALKLAMALAAIGLLGQHRVTLYTLCDKVVAELPPLKGQVSLRRLIDHLRTVKFGGVTQLQRCFQDFRPSRQRQGILFVISDLYGRDLNEAPLAIEATASWPGETHIIHVHHPDEKSPPLSGEVELVDVETGESRRLWLSRRDVERHEAAFTAWSAALERACLSRRTDFISWPTDTDFDDAFLALLSRGSALAGG